MPIHGKRQLRHSQGLQKLAPVTNRGNWHEPEQIRVSSVRKFEQGIKISRFLSIRDPLPLKHAPQPRQGPHRTGEATFMARKFELFVKAFWELLSPERPVREEM